MTCDMLKHNVSNFLPKLVSYQLAMWIKMSWEFVYRDLLSNWLCVAWFPVRLGAAATAAIHKLQKGIPPWVPLKGHEKKTYKQLQDEAYESKRRDLAVLEANNGVWPGVRIPSHALFLWASGSELTTLLEEDHMPNKYIPKDLRYRYFAFYGEFNFLE